MVEGGATVAGDFHRQGLVDQYVFYVAPVMFGGSDARPIFGGAGAPSIGEVWRGAFTQVVPLGGDLRIDVMAASEAGATGTLPVGRSADAASTGGADEDRFGSPSAPFSTESRPGEEIN